MMLYFGTDGNTKKELEQAFRINHHYDEELNNALNIINSCLTKSNSEHTTVSVVNTCFVSDTCKLKEDFLKKISIMGTVQSINYRESNLALEYINDWVSNNTNKLIPQLLDTDDITPNTLLTLINCLYFRGNWKIPFDPDRTHKRKFTTLSKDITDIDMMVSCDEQYPYWEDENAQYLEMFYKDKEFAMGIILPKNIDTEIQIPENLSSIVKNLVDRDVNIEIPKFKQKSKHKLNPLFEDMGVKDIFNGNADLSRIYNGNDISVSNIIQEVVVIVDESGTEAAAATAGIMTRNCIGVSKPINFVANHTFYYYIRHKPTNTIMFYGIWDGQNDL